MKLLKKLFNNWFGTVSLPIHQSKGLIEGDVKSNIKTNNSITTRTQPLIGNNTIYSSHFDFISKIKEKDFDYGISYESVINKIEESIKDKFELYYKLDNESYFKINGIFASKVVSPNINVKTKYTTSINNLSISSDETDSRIYDYLHDKFRDKLKKDGEEEAERVKEFLKPNNNETSDFDTFKKYTY